MKTLIALCLLMALIGCEKPTVITGGVSITTGEGQTEKLNRVPVRVYELKVFEKVEADAQEAQTALKKAASDKAKVKSEQRIAAERELEKAVAAHNRIAALGEKYNAKEKLLAEAVREVYRRKEELNVAYAEEKDVPPYAYPKSKAVLKNLREPLLTTFTDADGYYVLNVKRTGRYIIVVNELRKVGRLTENYYWAIPQECKGGNVTLQLSTGNLTDAMRFKWRIEGEK